jgi:hypothetical protein
MEVPMLEEHEWEKVGSLLSGAIQNVKEYREDHGVCLAEARDESFGKEALEMYKAITGFEETNPNALWHHRISLLGPPCDACGKPLRTAVAKRCVECGAVRSNKAIQPTR